MKNRSEDHDFCQKLLDTWNTRSLRQMNYVHGRPELVEKMKNEVSELLQKWGYL
ncbi:hypothetical protein [Bacillus sp. Marseille-P3661]|uniref:hypothetical protein n=1 Tax=Bacillus sp. Marseille-P3661 TaxID=1936234 RepID=UPI0015E1905C|nr:hypothetical protein [Bacillus sp. Marseille-P3661]